MRRARDGFEEFFREECPRLEIADALACAEPTVRVHLHRGRKALARRLDLEEAT